MVDIHLWPDDLLTREVGGTDNVIEYSCVKAAPPAVVRLRELSLLSPWPMVSQARHTWLSEAARQQESVRQADRLCLSIMLVIIM